MAIFVTAADLPMRLPDLAQRIYPAGDLWIAWPRRAVPWRFSAWEHLGAEVLVPQLVARGLIGTSSAKAMWLDLGGRPDLGPDDEGIDQGI